MRRIRMLREILDEAHRKYLEKNRDHGDAWKRMSILALKSAILLKAERIFHGVSDEKVVDDALDLINYSAMLIHRVRNESRQTI